MSLYLSLQLFELEEQPESEELQEGAEDEKAEGAVKPSPYRGVNVFIDDGAVTVESQSDDPAYCYSKVLGEQMSSEFLIQTERLDIRKWDPMYYSPAYAGRKRCSWVLDYCGLNEESTMRSGIGTYPKKWQLLLDLIDCVNDRKDLRREPVLDASEHAYPGSTGCITMVNILSEMQMPDDVVAAGILRSASRREGVDMEYVRENFDDAVTALMNEFGDDSGLSFSEKKIALVERVKASQSLYFKRIVLAEVLSDLAIVKAEMDKGQDFYGLSENKPEMGIFYAEIISALEELAGDDQSADVYRKLVDMYKEVFVSYSLDSVNGVIYQNQGDAAAVCLKRGEYDWKEVTAEIPEKAEPLTKERALFIAGLWRREADEVLVRDGNKAGKYDVPDMTVLKVVMGKGGSNKDRKDNKIVLSVLRRMIAEDEQIFAPFRAEEPDLDLIERGEVEDVNKIPVSFLGLEDDEGKTMAAVFTSMEEPGGIDEEDLQAIPVRMLFEFVKNMSRLDGIILDPFTDRFTVTKEKIAEILDDIKRDKGSMI